MDAVVAASRRQRELGRPAAIAATGVILAAAVAGCLAVALLNTAWFAVVNGFLAAHDELPRALLFSSWLVVIGLPIVAWRPRAFGFCVGDTVRHGKLVLVTIAVAATATAGLLTLVGPTPYSSASIVVETVVVPITEELVFRAVLLTALLAVLRQVHNAMAATVLAVAIDGLAFGAGHLANAATLGPSFAGAQAAFATVLGMGCAGLMARTRSVYPAIALHAAVNAVVVLL